MIVVSHSARFDGAAERCARVARGDLHTVHGQCPADRFDPELFVVIVDECAVPVSRVDTPPRRNLPYVGDRCQVAV